MPLVGLALLGIVALGLAPTAAAQGCSSTVTSGESIQKAVDAADAGDTVCVEDGTFSEKVVIGTSGLELRAASGASPVIDGSSVTEDDSFIGGVHVDQVDGVRVSGLEVTGFDEYGVGIDDSRNVRIDNNTITHNGRTGIHAEGTPDAVIANNTLRKNSQIFSPHDAGVFVEPRDLAATNVKVADNRIGDQPGDGIRTASDAPTIRGNRITKTTEDGIHVGVGNAVVVGNTIEEATGSGIYVQSADDVLLEANNVTKASGSSDYDGVGVTVSLSDATEVARNNLTGNDVGIYATRTTSIRVHNNTVEENDRGVWVRFGASRNGFHNNTIADNKEGVHATDADDVVDARFNAWGAADGPSGGATDPVTGATADGSGDAVTTNVRFDPWATSDPVAEPTGAVSVEDPIYETQSSFEAAVKELAGADGAGCLVVGNATATLTESPVSEGDVVTVTRSDLGYVAGDELRVKLFAETSCDDELDADATTVIEPSGTVNLEDPIYETQSSIEATVTELQDADDSACLLFLGNDAEAVFGSISEGETVTVDRADLEVEAGDEVQVELAAHGDCSGYMLDKDSTPVFGGTLAVDETVSVDQDAFDVEVVDLHVADGAEPCLQVTNTDNDAVAVSFTASEGLIVTITKDDLGGFGYQDQLVAELYADEACTDKISDAFVEVTAGEPVSFSLFDGAFEAQAGDRTSIILELEDEFGNPAPAREETILDLSSPSESISFEPSSEFRIPEGSTGNVSYYEGTDSGEHTIEIEQASGHDVGSTTIDVEILPGPPHQIEFDPPPADSARFVDTWETFGINLLDEFGNDAVAHRGLRADLVVAEGADALDMGTGTEAWAFETGDEVRSAPTVADGRVYVGSDDGMLRALDARDGTQIWAFDTEVSEGRWSPAGTDDRVYTSPGIRVHAVDAASGEELWTVNKGIGLTSPTVADGTVYVGALDGKLYALDAENGDQEWAFQAADGISHEPAVSHGTVYAAAGDGTVHAVDAETGEGVWSFNTGHTPRSAPLVYEHSVTSADFRDRVIVRSGVENLYALDAETGGQAWVYQNGIPITSPELADGAVFFGRDTKVHSLDAVHGYNLDIVDVGVPIDSAPRVSGSVGYIGTEGGDVHAFGLDDGVKIWSFPADGPIVSPPTMAGGAIYVASMGNSVHAIVDPVIPEGASGAIFPAVTYPTAETIEVQAAVDATPSNPFDEKGWTTDPAQVDVLPIEVDTCSVLDEPGFYELAADIEASETCFEITADDVELRGADHSIQAADGLADDPAEPAILIDNAQDSLVEDIEVTGWGTGIRVKSSSTGGEITRSRIEEGGTGVSIVESYGVELIDNEVSGNQEAGVVLQVPPYNPEVPPVPPANVIEGNRIVDNGAVGVKNPLALDTLRLNDIIDHDQAIVNTRGLEVDASLNHFDGCPEVTGPVQIEPILSRPPAVGDLQAAADGSLKAFGYCAELAPGQTSALAAPGPMERTLDETFKSFEGAVYVFDHQSQRWELATGDEVLGAMEAAAVHPTGDKAARGLVHVAETTPAQPAQRNLVEGWNLVGPRMNADAETAFSTENVALTDLMGPFEPPDISLERPADTVLHHLFDGDSETAPRLDPFNAYFAFAQEPGTIPATTPAGVQLDTFEEQLGLPGSTDPIQDGVISGDILEDTVLEDEHYLVSEPITVEAKLEIQAGTTLAFEEDTRLTFAEDSSLRSNGLFDDKIVFEGTESKPGWWDGIHVLSEDTTNTMEYVTVSDAGGHLDLPGAITLGDPDTDDGGALEVASSILRDSANGGFWASTASLTNTDVCDVNTFENIAGDDCTVE